MSQYLKPIISLIHCTIYSCEMVDPEHVDLYLILGGSFAVQITPGELYQYCLGANYADSP